MTDRASDPSALATHVLASSDALYQSRERWNLLWERSGSVRATARAELVAQWASHFASPAATRAVVVEAKPSPGAAPATAGKLLAAIPLVELRLPFGIRAATNPFNHWAAAGELLLDESAGQEVMDRLVEGIRGLGWPLLLLRGVPLSSPTYQSFEATCRRLGMATYSHASHEVGVVELGADYTAYMAARSKNHRAHMRKAARRAEREGGVSLQIVRNGATHELAAAIHAGFAVERSSWKGRVGSAVLDVDGLERYFETQAGLLAEAAALHLVFLEHGGHPIAFEYGYVSKGCYFTPKVGYDERFAELSPGQLLRAELFERFCRESRPSRIDFTGPLTDATAKWCTSTYPVGNLMVVLDRVRGTPLAWAYRGYQWYKHRRRPART